MKTIIEENRKRKARLFEGINQLTGEGISGRTHVSIPDYRHPEVWLPADLLESGLFAEVAEAGSIKAYLQQRGRYS